MCSNRPGKRDQRLTARSRDSACRAHTRSSKSQRSIASWWHARSARTASCEQYADTPAQRQSALYDLLGVEFCGTTGGACCSEMSAEATGRRAVWQRTHDQAIAGAASAPLVGSYRVHSVQQRTKIRFHGNPALANPIDICGTSKIKAELHR